MSDTAGNYSSAGPSGNMSFNPYNKRPMAPSGLNNHNEDTMVGNNDTKTVSYTHLTLPTKRIV